MNRKETIECTEYYFEFDEETLGPKMLNYEVLIELPEDATISQLQSLRRFLGEFAESGERHGCGWMPVYLGKKLQAAIHKVDKTFDQLQKKIERGAGRSLYGCNFCD